MLCAYQCMCPPWRPTNGSLSSCRLNNIPLHQVSRIRVTYHMMASIGALWPLVRIEYRVFLYNAVANLFVVLPVGLLTCNRAVIYLTTSRATEHLAALYSPMIRMAAAWVEAQSHLLHGLSLFVFLIQAGTRNTLSVVWDESVVISAIQFSYLYRKDDSFSLEHCDCNSFLEVTGKSSIQLGFTMNPFEDTLCATG